MLLTHCCSIERAVLCCVCIRIQDKTCSSSNRMLDCKFVLLAQTHRVLLEWWLVKQMRVWSDELSSIMSIHSDFFVGAEGPYWSSR